MRRVKLDEYLRRKADRAWEVALEIRNGRKTRPPARRPVDRESSENMCRFNRERWRLWLEKGWLVKLGERRYRLVIRDEG